MSAPTDHRTVPERLKFWADKQPDVEAFVFVDKDGLRTALTCTEIYDQASDFAVHLRHLGLKPGDIVCSLLPDSPNGIIAFFGILFAGCVVKNGTLHLLDGSFLIHNLNKTKCPALIISSDPTDECRRVLSQHFDQHEGNKVTSKSLPYLTSVIYTKENKNVGFQWETPDTDVTLPSRVEMVHDGNSDAIILLSSGTTGMSKLVVRSHASLMFTASAIGYFSSGSKSGCFNFHSVSWALGIPFYFLATGQKRVFIDQRKPPTSENFYQFIHDVICQENCDYTLMTATHLLRLVEIVQPKTRKWPMKECLLAGFPLLKSAADTLKPYFESIWNVYGSTESSIVSYKQIDKNTEFENFNAGIPYFGSEIIIKDKDNTHSGQSNSGSIFVKTKAMFKRYFGDEVLTKSVFDENGFYCMGDYGFLNEQGELVTYGRTSEVIMRGIDYFHPTWIETLIRTCPEVDDIIVVKVPDDQLLNELCACFVLIPNSNFTENNLRDFCHHLFVNDDSSHRSACPRYFILMDNIPVNKNSKPDRLAVEQYAACYLKLS